MRLEQRRYGYTMLMQTFLNDHNVDAVLSLQDRITQMTPAIVPDLAMYGCIIKAYTLAERYEEAWETWTYVRSHVSRPDSYLYSVMFGLCERVRPLFTLLTQCRKGRERLRVKHRFIAKEF